MEDGQPEFDAETSDSPGGREDPLAPFARLRGRFLLGLLFASLVLALLGALVGALTGYVPGVFTVMVGFYLVGLGVLAWIFRHFGIDARRLFGRFPTRLSEWLPAFLPAVASYGILTGLVGAIGLFSYFEPEAALRLANRSDEAQSLFLAGGPFWIVVLGAAVLAPIVEEIFFRGLLLHRWGWKWTARRAAVTTSIVFGLLHPPFILPQLIAGFIFARLYVQSGSLWLPIVGHAINNLAVVLVTFASDGGAPEPQVVTLEQLRVAGWVLTLLALAILIPIARWLRPLFDRTEHPLPYAR